MATTTPNFGWPVPTSTDLVKDGATAIEALGDGIDTSMVDLKGGLTGQVLAKATNADMDFAWVTSDDANAIQNSIVDAKGDLIAASANDTPARIAVGNNGETLVADSSTSTGLRYQAPVQQNPIINSAFQIWQRGTSISYSNNQAYSADRWLAQLPGTGTVSRQVTGDTTNLPNIQYCARVQRTSGQTTTTGHFLYQNFESVNSIPFTGKTVTYSFYARKGTNYSATSNALVANLYSGTGTDQNVLSSYTGFATVATTTATLTATWQRFSVTGTVATSATELALGFSFTPTGTAGADDYFEVTGVQLEVGSVATPFKTYAGTIQGELAACQRYYFKATASSAYTTFGVGANYSTTATQIHVNHPVQMRIGPASVDYSTLGLVNSIGGIVTFTTLTLSFTGPLTSMLGVTGASGLVAGYANLLLANNSTSGYLAFSSEL
jgi:hypothetical protein